MSGCPGCKGGCNKDDDKKKGGCGQGGCCGDDCDCNKDKKEDKEEE